ncbi:hypothetical protein Tco_0265977 [Tanacetum coccineum]
MATVRRCGTISAARDEDISLPDLVFVMDVLDEMGFTYSIEVYLLRVALLKDIPPHIKERCPGFHERKLPDHRGTHLVFIMGMAVTPTSGTKVINKQLMLDANFTYDASKVSAVLENGLLIVKLPLGTWWLEDEPARSLPKSSYIGGSYKFSDQEVQDDHELDLCKMAEARDLIEKIPIDSLMYLSSNGFGIFTTLNNPFKLSTGGGDQSSAAEALLGNEIGSSGDVMLKREVFLEASSFNKHNLQMLVEGNTMYVMGMAVTPLGLRLIHDEVKVDADFLYDAHNVAV